MKEGALITLPPSYSKVLDKEVCRFREYLCDDISGLLILNHK